jgi:carbon monoxide dehydrogenase subunit G
MIVAHVSGLGMLASRWGREAATLSGEAVGRNRTRLSPGEPTVTVRRATDGAFMDLSGEFRIPAPRATVWAALNDPDVLAKAIPGCQEIVKDSDTQFTARVVAKFGPVKATFGGRVTLSDIDPPNGYTISGEGTGGPAGFAKGGAKVRLEPDGNGTILRYEATGDVGGKLAQIGSRLVEGTARKLADDFFGRFAEAVTAMAPAAAEAPAAIEAAPPPAPAAAKGLPPWLWVAGVVLVVALILAVVALS